MPVRHSGSTSAEKRKPLRPHKHRCKDRSEWRLSPGKIPERLPHYCQFPCDFETSLMLSLNSPDRSEPIYLCEPHAREFADSTAARTSSTQSSGSTPIGSTPKRPAATAYGGLHNGQHGGRYRYILLLVAGMAVAGGLFGQRFFPAIVQLPKTAAAIAEHQKRTGRDGFPQKEPPKEQAALPQRQAQAIPDGKPRLRKQSLQATRVGVGGTVARKVLPNVPKSASDTIRGTILVSVRVEVDGSGKVEHAVVVFPGPSRYFRQLAVESAQHWEFNPLVVAGKGLQSEWTIGFYFTREGTRAVAKQAANSGSF